MTTNSINKKEAWSTIGIFLLFLTLFSTIAYYAILKLNPTSMYVGVLMISPSLATFATLLVKGKKLSVLPWKLKSLKYLKLSYLTPILYVTLAYFFIWIFGFGDFFSLERVTRWSEELGLEEANQSLVIGLMIFLLLTVGVVKNLGSTLGEEIGWRGFLIFELRKVMSFRMLSLVSGVIWAVWHYPIINLIYGRGEHLYLHIAAFTIMIIGISVILAYYTFKSESLWPAAIYHSVHNIFIQKIATPLTITNDNSTFWIDEYGFMIPIITTFFAIYFLRKAKIEGL
ncbi:abortive infection protein [Tenacibaculum holothuriorum]|uniref:Abortive infection protein n=1 Tax=Tenacibaculum holothuriorum TaxID=1635173 RepID=A0A1Y2PFY8_9FLAO|nr:CPBP family intramembrane glutamic endopeptidase [Tenacibaculum holothuriorum]OSY89345.1 abortive infection protein [Tenacibaculum holothuriorum]